MIISTVNCSVFGETTIELKDISELFTVYREIYLKTFNLTVESFNKIYKFKKERGGVLIVIRSQNNTLGLFTLSFAEDNFLELGDLMKLDKTFPRETYANAMKSACKYTIKQHKQDGIYIYPNPYAISLEKMAGFNENSLYVRNVSFVFFNFILLFPIQIYGGKIHYYRKFFKRTLIRRDLKVLPTRLKIFSLRIFKKSHHLDVKDRNVNIGFLYEFLPSEDYGDPFLVFGDNDFDVSKIGFEFCDNSA